MAGVFGHRRALAVAVLGGGEHALRLVVLRHQHGDDALTVFEVHAAHAARIAPHRAHVRLAEAHRLAGVGEQHDVALAVGDRHADEVVTIVEARGDDADAARVGEGRQRGLLDRALGGGHEDVVLLIELGDRQHGGDLLALDERKEVHDRLATGVARAFRHFVHLEPVHAAPVGEAEDVVVGIGDEELVDEVVVLHARRLLAAPAALLCAVVGERLALEVAAVRQRDDHVFRCDQVFDVDLGGVEHDLRTARVAELFAHRLQLADDDRGDALGPREDVEQVGDDVHHFAVLGEDLVLLQTGEALQAQFEDGLRLHFGEAVALRRQAEAFGQILGAIGVGHRARQHLLDQHRAPGARQQRLARVGGRRRSLDEGDDLVDVRQCHRQPFEDVAAFARAAQFVHGAPRDHLAAVREKAVEQFAQIQRARAAIDQRHHVHAESVLQLGLLEQLVEHHVGHFTALEFDHHAHAGLVGLVADFADALDLLVVDQFGHALQQGALVHLVRQLVDDDGLAVGAAGDVLEVGARAHHHAATPGAVAVMHASQAVDETGGREVRRLDDLDQGFEIGVGFGQQFEAGIDHLAEVVRRNVGRHADRDARRAVDEQVGNARRQDQRLGFGAVVVGAEIDGFLVDVEQQFVADARHADLGVTHRRRAVTIDRAEVALTIDQHVAQREILRHAHDGVIDRLVAVWVVLTDHVTDDTRRFLVWLVPVVGQLVHRIQHAPMHRLEAVARIRQRTPDDHAHRVIEVGMPHFLFQRNGQCFFGEGRHEPLQLFESKRSILT